MTSRIFGWAAVSTIGQLDRVSIPDQVARIEAYAATSGGTIVQMAIVPGHSRNYISLSVMREEFRRDEVPALDELFAAVESRAFDELVVVDADRIARAQSPFAEFVMRVVQSGAHIRILSDNMLIVTPEQAEIFIAMRGFFAASDARRLHKKYLDGTYARAAAGLHAVGSPPFTHVAVEDKTHAYGIRLEVDESKRRLFDDLIGLLRAGTSFTNMRFALARIGHRTPSGKPYANGFERHIFYSPYTWGHSGLNFSRVLGPWAYDESLAPPAPAEVFRNKLPAVYVGDQREELQALLKTRQLVRGGMRPGKMHEFSGVFICADCGHMLGVSTPHQQYQSYYRCFQYSKTKTAPCQNRIGISTRAARAQVNTWLEKLLTDDHFAGISPDVPNTSTADLMRYRDEAAGIERRISNLIQAQGNANVSATTLMLYARQINDLDNQLGLLTRLIFEAEYKSEQTAHEIARQERTLSEIRAESLTGFWQLPADRINQLLLSLLGDYRMVVSGTNILRVAHSQFPTTRPRLRANP